MVAAEREAVGNLILMVIPGFRQGVEAVWLVGCAKSLPVSLAHPVSRGIFMGEALLGDFLELALKLRGVLGQ
jgi:hypothetical protein